MDAWDQITKNGKVQCSVVSSKIVYYEMKKKTCLLKLQYLWSIVCGEKKYNSHNKYFHTHYNKSYWHHKKNDSIPNAYKSSEPLKVSNTVQPEYLPMNCYLIFKRHICMVSKWDTHNCRIPRKQMCTSREISVRVRW